MTPSEVVVNSMTLRAQSRAIRAALDETWQRSRVLIEQSQQLLAPAPADPPITPPGEFLATVIGEAILATYNWTPVPRETRGRPSLQPQDDTRLSA